MYKSTRVKMCDCPSITSSEIYYDSVNISRYIFSLTQTLDCSSVGALPPHNSCLLQIFPHPQQLSQIIQTFLDVHFLDRSGE